MSSLDATLPAAASIRDVETAPAVAADDDVEAVAQVQLPQSSACTVRLGTLLDARDQDSHKCVRRHPA